MTRRLTQLPLWRVPSPLLLLLQVQPPLLLVRLLSLSPPLLLLRLLPPLLLLRRLKLHQRDQASPQPFPPSLHHTRWQSCRQPQHRHTRYFLRGVFRDNVLWFLIYHQCKALLLFLRQMQHPTRSLRRGIGNAAIPNVAMSIIPPGSNVNTRRSASGRGVRLNQNKISLERNTRQPPQTSCPTVHARPQSNALNVRLAKSTSLCWG